MSATPTEYRGTVLPTTLKWREVHDELRALRAHFPVGSRIVHACGREGTVALDQPVHVPGFFDGQPTAVCFADVSGGRRMVFAHWDNDSEITWGVWVPTGKVRLAAASAANRPGNKALIGGRR